MIKIEQGPLRGITMALMNFVAPRAGQRTGAHAVEAMLATPEERAAALQGLKQTQIAEDRLLTPMEQAGFRALTMPMADNVDYWTRQYGATGAAELVGRLYDENGELVVKPDAAPRERAAAKRISK